MQKEINKLLKRVSAEKLRNNHKECIELYNIIGGLYSEIGSYDEATYYHEQALEICKTIGDRLATAIAFRYIGEAKAALGQFYQAIDYIKKYLDLAQRTNSKVEIQRAWTTLGRVYLMQAQDFKDNSHVIDDQTKSVALEAENRFRTALNLAESVREEVGEKEFMQMKTGLLINIGLVKDICGQHSESVMKFNRAIELCRSAKLKEDLYRCQIILTGIFRQKNNIKMAVRSSDDALVTAKQIGKKILICDAYIEKGLVQILQRDFKSAKRSFAQAYMEKSPSEEDHAKAIRLTKLAHLIATNHEKLGQSSISSESRLKLCDKLGDLFVAVSNYKLAVEFYRRALNEAKICCKPKNELARILVSIAETYADDGHFQHALAYYEKELSFRNGNQQEQCQTLLKIAHMHEYMGHEPEKTCEAYEKALDKAGKDPKLMYIVLNDYNQYLEKKEHNAARLKELSKTFESLKSYPEVVEEMNTAGNGEADDLEDEVSDIDEVITDDEGNNEVLMVGKRRSNGNKRFKANEVGDTPLHEACIKGDLKRVKMLISQGHEVNPRDNAGWIPLHEACNHGHFEVAQHLIEHGADVSNRGLKGMSPLHDAATNGHYEIMRLLMRNGANVIALTDTGETVLSCLRDYRKRNYSEMSNQEASEYKAMEAELLNTMDKSGFNLMEENMKKNNPGKKAASSICNDALQEVRPRPRDRVDTQEVPQTDSVRDYRHIMGNLKRKRPNHEDKRDSPKKANLPATYNAGTSNPSAPTKDWLIDDVSKEKHISRGFINPEDLVEFEEGFSDDDDDDIMIVSEENPRRAIESPDSIADDHPDPFDSVSAGFQTPPFQDVGGDHSISSRSNSKSSPKPAFDLFASPLTITIGERKLLIPVKDEYMTVKFLKESIVERYSALTQAKPIISLSPLSDPNCILFDHDLCVDVIKESVMANIESWTLDSIDETYVKCCEKAQPVAVEALTFIRAELRRIHQSGSKLDLNFARFPRNQVQPVLKALAHRDFSYANLTGSASLLDVGALDEGQLLLDTLASWRKLKNLKLSCIGLRRCHFGTICSKMRLPELNSLDVSINAIAYKCKQEFKVDVESLLEGCPNLKRLDISKNHLQFIKSILDSSREFERRSPASPVAAQQTPNSDGNNNLARVLELRQGSHAAQSTSKGVAFQFELLADKQKEYTIYSIN